jgi:hypothetical protein
MKQDLLERKKRLQPEQCSGARKLVARCSGEGWDFYACFNSGLGKGFGGLFSLVMDLWTLLDELVCLPLMGEGKQS